MGERNLILGQLVAAPNAFAVLWVRELRESFFHADALVVAHTRAATERLAFVAHLRTQVALQRIQ